jgi:hypothetical protein
MTASNTAMLHLRHLRHQLRKLLLPSRRKERCAPLLEYLMEISNLVAHRI